MHDRVCKEQMKSNLIKVHVDVVKAPYCYFLTNGVLVDTKTLQNLEIPCNNHIKLKIM